MCHICPSRVSKVSIPTENPSCGFGADGDCRYFKRRSLIDLADSELHRLRFQACERIAKLMIDSVHDDSYLFTDVLLRR